MQHVSHTFWTLNVGLIDAYCEHCWEMWELIQCKNGVLPVKEFPSKRYGGFVLGYLGRIQTVSADYCLIIAHTKTTQKDLLVPVLLSYHQGSWLYNCYELLLLRLLFGACFLWTGSDYAYDKSANETTCYISNVLSHSMILSVHGLGQRIERDIGLFHLINICK